MLIIMLPVCQSNYFTSAWPLAVPSILSKDDLKWTNKRLSLVILNILDSFREDVNV